jgi:hypothetical protein
VNDTCLPHTFNEFQERSFHRSATRDNQLWQPERPPVAPDPIHLPGQPLHLLPKEPPDIPFEPPLDVVQDGLGDQWPEPGDPGAVFYRV